MVGQRTMADLHFDGSVWCNINIALCHLETMYKQETELLGLTVIEWCVLQMLYDKDGQMASRLADGVGRAATSFTPILDKLQDKGFIERRSHPANQRAIRIYLTAEGKKLEELVRASVERIESRLRRQLSDAEWQVYQCVIEDLQSLTL